VRRLSGSSTRIAAVAALTVVSGVVALAWPATEQKPASETSALSLVRPSDKPSGPVEITSIDAQTTWSDAGSTVTVEVTNRSDRRASAQVWYLLADTDTSRPWQSPAGAGKPTDVALQARQRAEVRVPVKTPPQPGVWTLSLWAHTVDGERTTPSHGVAATPLVHVLPTNPDVVRRGEPGRHAALTVVEPVGRLIGGVDGAGPDALVSVQSVTSQPVQVELRCYLAPPGAAEPWRQAETIGSYVVQVPLAAGTPQVASCRFPSVPTQGDWELSAFVRRSGNAEVASHEDGLYSRRKLSFEQEPAEPH